MDISLLDPSMIPELRFAIGPLLALALPALIGAGGSLLGGLFGGSKGSSTAERAQGQAAQDQSALLRAAMEHQKRLKTLSGLPSASRGIFESTGGLGFQLPRGIGGESNAPDIFGNINFDAIKETGDLQSLLGLIPTGTGALTGAANIGASDRRFDAQNQGATASNIAQIVASLLANKGGGAPSVNAGSLGSLSLFDNPLQNNRRPDGGFGLGLS